MKKRGLIVQLTMGFLIFTGLILLGGSVADQMYMKNAYFQVKQLTEKAALAAAKNYQNTLDETSARNAATAIAAQNKIFREDVSAALQITFDADHEKVTAAISHYAFKTFWLRFVGTNSIDIDNISSAVTMTDDMESEHIAPFLINNQGLLPGASLSLTFANAGNKGASYNPADLTHFYPLDVERSSFLNFDGTSVSHTPCNGSTEKVMTYSDNAIFGSQQSMGSHDAALLASDNNPAFGNVNSILSGLSSGFPNFFNSDNVYAATFVSVAALLQINAGFTTENQLATRLNAILTALNAKNNWPTVYTVTPITSHPVIYMAVSNGAKVTSGQQTTTTIEEVVKVRIDTLQVIKANNQHSTPAYVKMDFTVLASPAKLIQ